MQLIAPKVAPFFLCFPVRWATLFFVYFEEPTIFIGLISRYLGLSAVAPYFAAS